MLEMTATVINGIDCLQKGKWPRPLARIFAARSVVFLVCEEKEENDSVQLLIS